MPASSADGLFTAANPASGLVSSLLASVAPQLAAGQAGIASAGLQAQLAPEQFGLESQMAANQYQNQLANLGLSQAGIGLSRQGLGLQQQLLGTQEGLAGQQYGLALGTPGSTTGGGLYAQLANLAFQYPLQVQQAQASAAGRGAGNTVGAENALSQLAEQYGYNTGNINEALKQAALGYQGQLAGFGYQQGQLGLSGQQLGLQQQQLGLQGQLAGQQYGYDTAQLGLSSALSAAQDQSSYLNAIAGQAQTIGQAVSPLGILQGSMFQMPAQPNTGN